MYAKISVDGGRQWEREPSMRCSLIQIELIQIQNMYMSLENFILSEWFDDFDYVNDQLDHDHGVDGVINLKIILCFPQFS